MGKHNGDEFRARLKKNISGRNVFGSRSLAFLMKASPFLVAVAVLFLIGPLALSAPLIRPAGFFFMALAASDVTGRPAVLLMLSGESSEIWGGWEDLRSGRVGLVEGTVGDDGSMSLTFRGNFRRKTGFRGWFSLFGEEITGFFPGAARDPRNLPFCVDECDKAGGRIDDGCLATDGRGKGLLAFRRVRGNGSQALNRHGLKTVEQGTARGSASSKYNERHSIMSAAGSLFSTVAIRVTWLNQSRQVATSRLAVVSAADGIRLSPDDLFLPGWQKEALHRVGAAAGREAGISEGQTLMDAGFFSADMPPGDDMFICRSGIGFGYDRYRLAPYAAGDFRFVIPWSELGEILRPGILEKYGLSDLAGLSGAPERSQAGRARGGI